MWMPAPCRGLIDLVLQAEMEDVLTVFFMQVLWCNLALNNEYVHQEVIDAGT